MTTLPCRRGRRRSCTRNPHRPAAVLAPGWSQHTLTPPDIVNSLSEGRVPCGVHVFRSPNIHKSLWMQGPEAARRGAPRQTKASVILRRRQEDARTPRRPPPVGCPSEGETQPTDRSDISPRPVRQVVSRNVTRNSRPSEVAAPAAPRESLRRTPLVSHPLQGRRRASLSPAASEGRLGPAFAAVSYSDGWACFVP